jgi:hypothetical protein
MLVNPDCAPRWAIALFVSAIYFSLGIIVTIIRILIFGWRGMLCIARWKWKLCRFCCGLCGRINKRKKRMEKRMEKQMEEEEFELGESPRRPIIQMPMKASIHLAILLLIMPKNVLLLETITAKDEHCVVNAEGHRNCIFENVIELSFGLNGENQKGQDVQIILNDGSNKPAGKITLNVHAVEQKCKKLAKFFTRDYEMDLNSAYQCGHNRHCTDSEKCAKIQKDELLQDLGTANNYPGVTACVDTCKKNYFFCDECSTESYVCLFYRYYAHPTSERIYEIFECPEYQPYMRVKIELETAQNKVEEIVKLLPGWTLPWNDIHLTATSMTIPTVPVANKPVLTDGNKYAILGEKEYQFVQNVQCPSGLEAKRFKNCQINSEICSCTDKTTKMECDCLKGKIWETVFTEGTLLPQINNGRLTKVENGELILVPEMTAAMIQVRLAGMTLRTQVQLNSCKFEASDLVGCYSCAKGATVVVKCVTDFGRALADIVCPSFRTAVTCGPEEGNRTLSIHVEHYEVDEECEVFCPASTSSFILKGKLAAPEIDNLAIDKENWIASSKSVYHVDWIGVIKKLFDFSNLWIWLMCICIFPVLYFLLPIIISAIFLIFSCFSRLLIAKTLSRGSVGKSRTF